MIPDGFGYRQQQNDSHVLLAAGAMILSILLHVVALYYCSSWSVVNRVNRVRDLPADERVPPMRVGVLTSDPITVTDEVKGERQKPAETPVDINSKVDALSQETNPALTTPQPIPREALSPDTIATRMQPQALDATPWMPRQEIAQIFDRKVQDEVATLPRLEIPLVERIQKAPDIVPSILEGLALLILTLPKKNILIYTFELLFDIVLSISFFDSYVSDCYPQISILLDCPRLLSLFKVNNKELLIIIITL
jgi:hypothetical protein